jgi:uncharacterized protein YlxW (UPF0749 family)
MVVCRLFHDIKKQKYQSCKVYINHFIKKEKIMSLKEEYVKKLQAQLNEWSAEINTLKAKADSAHADAQIEYYKQVEELRSMQNTVARKLTELEDAGDDAWEELKAGIDSAWDTLHDALKSAASKFK